MPDRLITTQDAFDELCDHLESAGRVTFDTEFVSEGHYRPELCLLQFATQDKVAAVDPFAVPDLRRWWDLMANPATEVIVHGGREEILFCLRYAGRPPGNLVDVQVAEGLRSRGFPLSHGALLQRVLGVGVDSHQTRTDWERRPLTKTQVDYALEDVAHLLAVWDRQKHSLTTLGRLDWVLGECHRRVEELASDDRSLAWQKLPGLQRLSRREMAVARELFVWREQLAEQRDRTPRSLLRDDLLIDLARRRPQTVKEATATRGMNRRDYLRMAEDMLACVDRAMQLPDSELPHKPRSRQALPQEEVLGKLLGIALAHRCAELGISTSIVGTQSDLQDLVRWEIADARRSPPPRLMQDWRADVCGNVLSDLIEGRVSLRVSDPLRDDPLCFERVND